MCRSTLPIVGYLYWISLSVKGSIFVLKFYERGSFVAEILLCMNRYVVIMALCTCMSYFDFDLFTSVCFCTGVPFPKNFLVIAKTILKRLFRVYAHIYHQHFREVVSLGEEAHLNTSFKHFIFFVQEFNLIDKRELQPLAELIEKLTSKDRWVRTFTRRCLVLYAPYIQGHGYCVLLPSTYVHKPTRPPYRCFTPSCFCLPMWSACSTVCYHYAFWQGMAGSFILYWLLPTPSKMTIKFTPSSIFFSGL